MRTLDQLVGTTNSASFTTYPTSFTSLTQNNSAQNVALGKQLISDQHRYLLQKYFDNERTVTTTTVGGQTLTLTSAPSAGDTSATLSAAWPYVTGSQLVNFTGKTQTATTTVAPAKNAVSATLTATWAFTTATINTTFSSGDIRAVNYTNGSTAITWGQGLSTAATVTLTTVSTSDQRTATFTNNSTAITWALALDSFATTSLGTVGYQAYNVPANISKIKNDTINVGQLRFVPAPIQTRAEWDLINFIPYTSDIPNYFFIYQGQLLLWPIPSTTGNIITFNYKARVPDLSFSDYTTGTIATAGMTVGSTAVTGTGTTWSSEFPLNTDVTIFNLFLRADPSTGGDGIWYPISKFLTDTTLTLLLPVVNAPNITSSTTYTIGQVPLLSEDFHDMMVYGALMTYYSTIVENQNKFNLFKTMYTERMRLLEDYAGSKSVNVDLGASPQLTNPNLYPYAQSS